MRAVLLPACPTWVRFLDLPGQDAGPVRVFLAGLGSAATAEFPEIVARPVLSTPVMPRTLLVDLPGTGWSDEPPESYGFTIEEHADAVGTVLAAAGLRGCAVVGHSLGGSVAIALARQRPDLVGRLVVCEPNLDPGVGTLSRHIADQSEDAFVTRGYDALRAVIGRDGDATSAVFHGTTGRWSSRGMYRTSVSLLAERTPTFREQLRAIRVPRAFVAGAHSTDVELRGLCEAGVSFHVVPDAGHPMAYDNPDGFAAALAAALAGQPGQSPPPATGGAPAAVPSSPTLSRARNSST